MAAVQAAGAANTGGGGGGGAFNSSLGGAGGSGIVVVRYPGNVQFYTGGTVNYNNGYIIHIFTSNGTLAPTTPAPYNTSYQISRSLRFNSADSAYLDRAQTTGSTQKATWSGWVKRSALTIGAYSTLFNAGTANTDSLVWNNTGDTLRFWLNGASSADLVTTQQFRDPSAWYHIVIAIDTTQSTAANRILMYVNGVQVTAFTTATYPTQNYTFTKLNTSGQSAYLGGIGASLFFSGYMTEVNFVDGQQLAATSFGATSTTTGVWAPIQYTGTYGTNGFYLNFSDNSNTTAATLGKDYSGNGNNWTPNNFSVTAGAGNDSMVDSPTQYGFDTGVGGSVRGNYATLNPIGNPSTPTYSITNGNLDYAATGSVGVAYQQAAIATIGVTSGKWYYEGTVTSNNPGLGFSSELFYQSARGTIRITYYSGSLGNSAGITATGSPATFTNGDVIAVAYDADAGTATVYKNNVSQGTFSGIAIGTALFPYVEPNTAAAASGVSFNFGQRPFAYTAPSGFKALCTQNLPTPTIGATSNTLATQFFAPVLWTGTGTQTRSITGLDFQPDLTWMKIRADTPQDHQLYDAVRGAGGGKNLSSNTNAAEGTVNGYPDADYGYVSSFDSGGFSVNDGAVATTGGYVNYSGRTYVAWNWRAGNNAGASNSAGSITSTVSANTTSGFSVVTYTGTGSAGATVGHGLGAVPSMIIFKRRNATSDWQVYHTSLGNANSVYLNLTNSSAASPGMLNSTTPTSTLITLGTSTDTNPSTGTMVAYCFAEVAGYSKFGSYTGNGSADGPFVFTGFRPAYVMVKRTSSAGTNWQILDTKRSTYNVMADYLYASAANVEGYDTSVGIDSLSNGFKIRGTDANTNTNSATYIYMAFAENPFKYSLAR